MVIELTAASDFNKFISVVFQTLEQNPCMADRRPDKGVYAAIRQYRCA
ncbi:hypothetical protein HMPREF0208_01044 [Citrobacter koseri]|uniref:Uncharacterized protein n=1 Tax=Citrobacter koseri (strain ATCC BAA-895 / CDC 4225-83 / SGSC4696) TaxID=290338 RepID=A8AI05_CITK8|nr:hypothetical protein CKO_01991 [Citrobacter koseri ATCC BAA-895]KWZ99372.1 hypothetical protein HMPREF3220_02294 [Citrobacter koseri]KXA04459.1 hypothetical protein HMPREF3207_01444 [Citrobacter koseri]KXB45843.1 hypothetical protein HMPREF0208_01044 [Citrobacter koseri]